MSNPDLTYSSDGLFVTFWPETPAGEDAWRVIAEQTEGTGKVLFLHLSAVLQQLRAAGYCVRKRKPERQDAYSHDDEALLRELEA